jgi:hypothetical protein
MPTTSRSRFPVGKAIVTSSPTARPSSSARLSEISIVPSRRSVSEPSTMGTSAWSTSDSASIPITPWPSPSNDALA